MQQCERHDAAAMRRMRGADPFLGSVERIHVVRPGTEAHCMMKVSSAPRGRWGRTWSLSLSLSLSHPPSLLHAGSLPPPPLSRLARSLALSPPTPSRRTHAAATRAAPMTLPRLPLLLLARTYSRVRDTRRNCNGRSSISVTSTLGERRDPVHTNVHTSHRSCFSQLPL